MKKLLLLSFVLAGITGFAQTHTRFGIEAGFTSSSIKGNASESFNNLIEKANGYLATESKAGIYAGVNANIPLNEMFSVQPGLHYAQKGYVMKGEMTIKGMEFLSPDAKATLVSHYVDLPLLLKANLNGLEVFAGPQVSYLAAADLKAAAGVGGFNFFRKTFDATEQLNRWDAGLKAGLGYQFSNGINISAAYDHGLVKADANQNVEAYNRSFRLGLGLRF